jgi:hypothetical protein
MLLDELAALLQAAGIGVSGQTLFRHALPLEGPLTSNDPPQVALIEVAGMEALRTQDAQTVEQPVVSVMTRGAPHGYVAAREKAQEAWEVLDGVSNQVLSGVRYLWIFTDRSPYWLRTDDLARPLIAFAIRCARALP